MNVLNKENLKSILKPFKEKMDSCITEEQLKSELDNYVTEDNATINNSLSIKNASPDKKSGEVITIHFIQNNSFVYTYVLYVGHCYM